MVLVLRDPPVENSPFRFRGTSPSPSLNPHHDLSRADTEKGHPKCRGSPTNNSNHATTMCLRLLFSRKWYHTLLVVIPVFSFMQYYFIFHPTPTATPGAQEQDVRSSVISRTMSSPLGGWASLHQVDCKSFIDETDEVYKQTSTEPSFIMNIHKPSADDVSRNIWEKGCWECDHIKAVTKALSQYKNSYFLDIGGNIGMWSLSAAAANYQTVTIEALPDNYRRFCLSVNKNLFHNRTHLLSVAATEQPAAFRLHKARNNFGGTRVVPIDSNENILKDDKDIVQGVTVDSLNLPTQQPVVLKLDVEGHELSVLSGANHFLQNANIVYAMMELRPGLHKDPRWKSIFQVLHSKGLKPYRINYEDETALDIDRLSEWIHFKHPKVRYFDVVWRLSDFVPPDA